MALDLKKYKLIPLTDDGRGEQPRIFTLSTDDDDTAALAPGYLDELINLDVPLLGRKLIEGDMVILRFNADGTGGTPGWTFLQVEYDAGNDTYTLSEVFPAEDPLSSTLSYQTEINATEAEAVKLYFASQSLVNEIKVYCMTDIEVTDDATVTPADSGGTNMTDGAITVTAGSVATTEFFSFPTSNNTVAASDFITITTSKTTKPGGKLLITVVYDVIPAS